MQKHPLKTQPAVFGYESALSFDAHFTNKQLEEKLSFSLDSLVLSLQRTDRCFIGHIKGIFKTKGHGSLLYSVTTFDEPVRFKGDLTDGFTDGRLSINIIVFNVPKQDLKNLFFDSFHSLLGKRLPC